MKGVGGKLRWKNGKTYKDKTRHERENKLNRKRGKHEIIFYNRGH